MKINIKLKIPTQNSGIKSLKAKGHGHRAFWITKQKYIKFLYKYEKEISHTKIIPYSVKQAKTKGHEFQIKEKLYFVKQNIINFYEIMIGEIENLQFGEYKNNDNLLKAKSKYQEFLSKYQSENDSDLIASELWIQPNKWESKKQFQFKSGIYNDYIFYFTVNYLSYVVFKYENGKWYFQPKIDYNYVKNNPFYKRILKKDTENKRINPTAFRTNVLDKYNNECILTKITLPNVLDACHIKTDSYIKKYNVNSSERSDTENGICLSKTFHKLFDDGWFTFDTSGNLIFSEQFKTTGKNFHLINKTILARKFPFSNETQKYMNYHRNFVFVDILYH